MNFENIQGPVNYVHVQIPSLDKIFHFFGDIHAVGTHCDESEPFTPLPVLVDQTLKYYKNNNIDIYYEFALGSNRVHFRNTYIGYFHRFFSKKGCFYHPRDVQCELEYPNARFHSVDFRATLKQQVDEKIKQTGKTNISEIKESIFQEIMPFINKYEQEGFIFEKEFIFLNFILHILSENPEKYKTYLFNSSINFGGALYLLLKDQNRLRYYVDIRDNKMKKIPGIDSFPSTDIEVLHYPFFLLHKSISKIEDPILQTNLLQLIQQRVKKWSSKRDYSQEMREQSFPDRLSGFSSDECSELLDFYVLIRLFKSSQKRVILYMGMDHVGSVINLLESLSLKSIQIYEFVKQTDYKGIIDSKHQISQCIPVPILSDDDKVLSMEYMDYIRNMDYIGNMVKNSKNKVNHLYKSESESDITQFLKFPGKIGKHPVIMQIYDKYLRLPKEKQIELIQMEEKEEMEKNLSLSFQKSKKSKKSIRKSRNKTKNKKKSIRNYKKIVNH